MPLTSCRECGKQVSTEATSCPHCGVPTPGSTASPISPQPTTMSSPFQKPHQPSPHSRPHVSNDNPFSEAQFKTLKYRPAFPDRFGSIQDARAYCHGLFPWYNTEHHHSGLGLLTPYDVHYGLAEQRVAARATVLASAYAAHPERFPAGPPQPPSLPVEVWINPPKIPLQPSSATTLPPLAQAAAFA
jgi:hypothetical protein